ncbi:MAG: glucose-6-phosphate isomerase, partial [Clostridia bacterium]|nr:glucose-6-phosphate isomerase [Clostridia bacterium]
MSVRVNTDFLAGFIRDDEINNLRPYLTAAHKTLLSGNGAGSDYLGWVTLPDDYDRAEFARIKAAAERIKGSCDIFLVLGIGGSYLGARAAIEFVKSPLYNALEKDTPEIYFAGNNLSPTAISELLSICRGKELCVNVISKSGTTTETAVAFRIF